MRADDLHMAATIDPKNRFILVTGAIDRNDATVVLRVDEIPEPGLWTVVKAEVNLTGEPWTAWQMTLGDGVALPDKGDRLLLCRQLPQAEYFGDRNAIVFSGGEVRPGEAVLKVARLVIEKGLMVMSHNRMQTEVGPDVLKEGFGMDDPKVEVEAAVRIADGSDFPVS